MVLWDPLPTIWFVYALLLAFVIGRATRAIAPPYLIAAAAIMMATTLTSDMWGPVVIGEKLGVMLVYFLIGAYASAWIRDTAAKLTLLHVLIAAVAFAVVALTARVFDRIDQPLVFFTLSCLSATVLIGLAHSGSGKGTWLRIFERVGAHSLYIYLVHFLPASGIRIVLFRLGIDDPLIVFPLGVAGSVAFGIAFYYAVRSGPTRLLIQKPDALRV